MKPADPLFDHVGDAASAPGIQRSSLNLSQIVLYAVAVSVAYGILFSVQLYGFHRWAYPLDLRDHLSLCAASLAIGLAMCLACESFVGRLPMGWIAKLYVLISCLGLVFRIARPFSLPFEFLLVIPASATLVLIVDRKSPLAARIALSIHGLLLVIIAHNSSVFDPRIYFQL